MSHFNASDVVRLTQGREEAIAYARALPQYTVDTQEAARVIDVSVRSLESWRSDGTGPMPLRNGRNGRRVRYVLAEVIAFKLGLPL